MINHVRIPGFVFGGTMSGSPRASGRMWMYLHTFAHIGMGLYNCNQIRVIPPSKIGAFGTEVLYKDFPQWRNKPPVTRFCDQQWPRANTTKCIPIGLVGLSFPI